MMKQPVSMARERNRMCQWASPVIRVKAAGTAMIFAPAHASEVDALVRAADQAMYQAKRQRGQVCVFQPSD